MRKTTVAAIQMGCGSDVKENIEKASERSRAVQPRHVQIVPRDRRKRRGEEDGVVADIFPQAKRDRYDLAEGGVKPVHIQVEQCVQRSVLVKEHLPHQHDRRGRDKERA